VNPVAPAESNLLLQHDAQMYRQFRKFVIIQFSGPISLYPGRLYHLTAQFSVSAKSTALVHQLVEVKRAVHQNFTGAAEGPHWLAIYFKRQ